MIGLCWLRLMAFGLIGMTGWLGDGMIATGLQASTVTAEVLDDPPTLSVFPPKKKPDPPLAELHYSQGRLRLIEGDRVRAAHAFRHACELDDTKATYLNSAAWPSATSRDFRMRDPQFALEAARKAVELGQKEYEQAMGDKGARFMELILFQDTLAAAQAAAEDFVSAVKTQNAVLKNLRQVRSVPDHRRGAPAWWLNDLDRHERDMEDRLKLYEGRKPYFSD